MALSRPVADGVADGPPVMPYMIGMAGLIGSGKSTLVRACTRHGILAVYEPIDRCPWMALYYREPKKYANVVQAWMLKHRVHDILNALVNAMYDPTITVIIIDLPWPLDWVYVDANVFFGNIGIEFRDKYDAAVAALHAAGMPLSDLTAFLDLTTDECQRRKTKRGREMEKGVDVAYQRALLAAYAKARTATEAQGARWTQVPWDTPIEDEAAHEAAVEKLLRTEFLPAVAPEGNWGTESLIQAVRALPRRPMAMTPEAMGACRVVVNELYRAELAKMAENDIPLNATH